MLATYYRNTVFAKMQELRAVGDSMETETAKKYWPYPTYTELFCSEFNNKRLGLPLALRQPLNKVVLYRGPTHGCVN